MSFIEYIEELERQLAEHDAEIAKLKQEPPSAVYNVGTLARFLWNRGQNPSASSRES